MKKRDSLSLVSGIAQRKMELEGSSKVCMICGFPPEKRRAIEEMMARGCSNTSIILFAREACQTDISSVTIARHVDHLPAKLFVFKEIVERRAREDGIDLDDSQSRLTPVGYLEMLMNDSASAIARHPGTTNPFIGIQAAKALMEVDSKRQDDQSVMEWAAKFRQILTAIKEICSEDQVRQILDRLRSGDAE